MCKSGSEKLNNNLKQKHLWGLNPLRMIAEQVKPLYNKKKRWAKQHLSSVPPNDGWYAYKRLDISMFTYLH